MQQSRPGEVISHSQVAAAAMAENADGGYESFPFHNTIEVKGRNRGKLCFLFYLSCIICFFYHRFFGTDWKAANALEFVAIFCELFFAYLWVQNQIMTWFFTVRYTDPERLCRSYGYANLPPVDIFITTMDPWKEPPLILVNTILSVLSVDYPFENICCYVSDDGGSPLNFYAVLKAYEFAEKWVPFCKKFNIEPRVPMVYFSRPALNKSESSVSWFNGEWKELKKKYEKVKLDIRRAMESCGQVPTEVQDMFDQLSGNQTIEIGNHPGLIKSFDQWVDHLPRLIYVSREKRPGWKHHYKAGALNCLARVSGVITNSPFILNLDCDMYVNNSKALLHAMCFHLDPHIQEEDRLSFVQFPQHFSGIDEHDIYGTKMTLTFDVAIRGIDGLQGPIYLGTGCVHRRKALFGSKPRSRHSNEPTEFHQVQKSKISYETLTEMFGESPTFLASVVNAIGGSASSTESLNYSTQDILQLISPNYEVNTKWGEEVGWMYGSSTEDILTGYKMHRKGWRSVYCCPHNPAFIGTAPSKLVDVLEQKKRWSKGLLEVFLSKNCPLFGRYGNLNFLQRLVYIHICSRALYSIPLMVYGLLPTASLILGKHFIPKVFTVEFIPFILIFGCNYILNMVQSKWLGIYRRQWWNNMRMWMIVILTSDVVATFEVLLNLLGLKEDTFLISPKSLHDDENGSASESTAGEGFSFDDDSFIFIIPTVYALFNIWGLINGLVNSMLHGNIMTGELFCVGWVLFNLFPFVRGLFKEEGKAGALGLTTALYSFIIVGTCAFLLLLYNVVSREFYSR
eukprot:PITA_20142